MTIPLQLSSSHKSLTLPRFLHYVDRARTSTAPTPHHPKNLRLSHSFIIRDPPHSIASNTAPLRILPPYNGLDNTSNQNATHLTSLAKQQEKHQPPSVTTPLGGINPHQKRDTVPIAGSKSTPSTYGGSPKSLLHSEVSGVSGRGE